jgi:hypothetical protein
MDERDLDRIAGQLGAAAPFPVDWDTYATQLIGRLSRAERQRRRRSWWVALAGTLAGAAAAWFIAVHVAGTRNAGPNVALPERVAVPFEQDRSKQPELTVLPAASSEEPPLLVCVRRPGTLFAVRSAPVTDETTRPFVQRTTHPGGRVSEIRFHGFTPEGAERAGLIVISEEGRRLPEHPTTGL